VTDKAASWLTVIIVNYNGKRFLQGALDSLAKQTSRDFDIILVDNASTDGSLDDLNTEHLPSFRLIASPDNLGFAAANNLAAREAKTKWMALLNPDAEAREGWVAAWNRAIQSHPDVSMFAGATLSMADPGIIDGAGDAYFGLGLPWRGGHAQPRSQMPANGTCFSPCGAAALYRRDVFLDAGGFEERFFCYCEDVDLAFRLRLRGQTCIFWPDAEALHYGTGTSAGSDFAAYHGARNRIWTFCRNMPPIALILLSPLHIVLNVALLLRAALRKELKPTWRGIADAFAGPFNGRRDAQMGRVLSSLQVLSAMSWNPLRMLARKSDVRPLKKPQEN